MYSRASFGWGGRAYPLTTVSNAVSDRMTRKMLLMRLICCIRMASLFRFETMASMSGRHSAPRVRHACCSSARRLRDPQERHLWWSGRPVQEEQQDNRGEDHRGDKLLLHTRDSGTYGGARIRNDQELRGFGQLSAERGQLLVDCVGNSSGVRPTLLGQTEQHPGMKRER